MERIDGTKACLLVVDVQRGFSPLHPEELPVPGALEIIPKINTLMQLPWRRIDASLDWHPPNHRSFFTGEDRLYPPHCVAGTPGAEFLPGLDEHRFHAIWRKGYRADFEAYAVTAQHPGLPAFYRAEGIETVAVCGIATNICCFFAARDLKQAGFRVLMVEGASAGIDIPQAQLFQERAKREGQELGIEYTTVAEIENHWGVFPERARTWGCRG